MLGMQNTQRTLGAARRGVRRAERQRRWICRKAVRSTQSTHQQLFICRHRILIDNFCFRTPPTKGASCLATPRAQKHSAAAAVGGGGGGSNPSATSSSGGGSMRPGGDASSSTANATLRSATDVASPTMMTTTIRNSSVTSTTTSATASSSASAAAAAKLSHASSFVVRHFADDVQYTSDQSKKSTNSF